MEKYTIYKIKESVNGWLVINNETKEKDIVFVSLTNNTQEEAIRVLEEAQNPSDIS